MLTNNHGALKANASFTADTPLATALSIAMCYSTGADNVLLPPPTRVPLKVPVIPQVNIYRQ